MIAVIPFTSKVFVVLVLLLLIQILSLNLVAEVFMLNLLAGPRAMSKQFSISTTQSLDNGHSWITC